MLRASAFLLSIPLLLAIAACGGPPPPKDGGSGVPPEKSSGLSGSDASKEQGSSDGDGAPDDGTAVDKKTEGTSRGPGNVGSGGSDKEAAEGSGNPPPPKQAAVSSTPLSGKLTQQEIADILSRNAAYFNDCYTIGAGKGQEFRGTVTVKATLGPSGAVTVAEVIKSTAKNAKVDACVVTAFKKIKFPAPKDGGTSVITFPMEFLGVEQVK
jgi:TonB family protein